MHIGGADFDKQLSLAHVMPLLGLGSQPRSGATPSTQYGNLACWHTINQAYTRKAAEHFATSAPRPATAPRSTCC